ncbi:putative ribonuclease H-like domain-containing protein [Tanacetum coccineum]|uniref:Ribonuclease H-like domain-containing protein n=1 Tax=Tanacetum coccineum TaxID=301880 RepID=A0ABQ5B1G5_9ASTR
MLVAQGYRQEEGIDYDDVFAPMARIESIKIFLAFASYIGFIILSSLRRSTKLKKLCMVYTKLPDPDEFYRRAHLLSWITSQIERRCTPIETQKPFTKDEEATNIDVHLYRSMIGSLMYLTASRPDIMFAVCACSRFQIVIMLEQILRGNLNGGCNFWKETYFMEVQEADQLWLLLLRSSDTKIYIDNESTICIVKNPMFHSKTKHIEIRHHFIRDAHKKKLIQVLKIHTDDNVADLLTKALMLADSIS